LRRLAHRYRQDSIAFTAVDPGGVEFLEPLEAAAEQVR
jgi:hypothetical protein